jgi:hypothetical protein
MILAGESGVGKMTLKLDNALSVSNSTTCDPNRTTRPPINGMKRQPTATLTAKKHRLALLLAGGRAIKIAASEVGIGERTAHTWISDPGFQTAVAELRGRMLDAALGRLADASTRAVETLVALLDDDRSSVRLRAALGILDIVTRLQHHTEFERRIAAVEAYHASRTGITAVTVRENGQRTIDGWAESD